MSTHHSGSTDNRFEPHGSGHGDKATVTTGLSLLIVADVLTGRVNLDQFIHHDVTDTENTANAVRQIRQLREQPLSSHVLIDSDPATFV
jgi:hypothetical protein